MHTKPHTASGQTTHPWLTAEWVYDAIMRHIDEDLLTGVLPTLAQKYAGESEEERLFRAHRYKEAFRTFDAAFARMQKDMHDEVQQIRAARQERARVAEASERTADVQAVEEQFESPSAA